MKDMKKETKTAPQPIKKFRCGGVAAAIWANNRKIDGEDVLFHNVTIQKSYKDKGSDEWKTTNSYNTNDLAKLSIVVRKAQEFLLLSDMEDDDGQEE